MWWKLAKEICNQSCCTSTNISASNFRTYFMTLLNTTEIINDISYAPMFYTNPLLDSDFTTLEIIQVLNKVKLNKAPGEDRIPYEFYKNAPIELLNELAQCYNTLYNNMRVDEAFLLSIIYPIFKKGNVNLPNNYRGISFMNCIAKIMMGILSERLYKWTEQYNIISEYQAGFRKGYSTMDNIYNLAAIVHLKLNKKKKVYCFFVDFKSAFDKVSRNSLIFKLNTIGISTKMVNFIRNRYHTTKFAVWNGYELSDTFETKTGVKQGCLLSPLLFSLYINDLHDHLKGGINLEDLNIRILLYADDIVILAEEVETLQQMMKRLEEYCDYWNLEINITKSKIMVFRNGGRLSLSEKWFYKGNEVEIVNEFNYLGVLLTPKMVFTKHVLNRNSMAKGSINATWNTFLSKPNTSIKTKYHLFNAVSRSIQAYAAQVWGHSHFEEVDKLQRYFLKRILKLPKSTPNYALMLESGLEDCHLYTLNLNLNYIKRTLFEFKECRLPHKLSVQILENRVFWADTLNQLGGRFNIQWYPNINVQQFRIQQQNLINALKIMYNEERVQRALQTDSFYSKLNFRRGQHYLMNMNDQNQVAWIFKSRCDLIKLNGSRFSSANSSICSLCNTGEVETIQHFICKCPIFNYSRLQQFGYITISEEFLIKILNGEFPHFCKWDNLVKYIINTLQYRSTLISEFNY